MKAIIMLNMAAKFAMTGDYSKNYLLAALGIRRDGAATVSTNALTKMPMFAAHAEARCLRKMDSGSVLYIARILRDNKTWAMSKPCPRCQSRIRNKRVARVYYTIEPNKYGIWDVKNDNWYVVHREP